MASKLLNLVAVSSLAVLAVTFGATPTNALATGHSHMNRHFQHGAVARKKRDQSQRCKARPSTASSSSAQPTSSAKPAADPTTTPSSTHKASSTKAPAKTTTSKSSSSTQSSSGSSAAGSGKFGKKGSKICLAWGDGDDSSITQFKTSHVVGIYNWGVSKPAQADALGFEYMPMLWGSSQDKIDAFVKAMEQPGLGNIVLAFNEPNEVGQSNMDPQTAASLWKQYIEPQREKGYLTCSPAMSSRPNGFQWMADFMKACDGCHVDYQCVHWYDTTFDKLQTYLTQYHDQLGLPILLTEFADQNFNGGSQATSGEIFSFMNDALKFVDNTDWMVAACPFGVMHDLQGVNPLNLLQNTNGSPTDLAYMIINNSYN